MRNDDFSPTVKDMLAKRVGVRCSNPACRKLTIGPRDDSTKSVNIGVAAHITAASPAGPRFDSSLSSEQRKSANNGIWLCQNCAKLIDNDQFKYTVALLQGWKQVSEEQARIELEGGKPDTQSATVEEPIKFANSMDPVCAKIIKDYKTEGETPCLPAMSQKDSKLIQGYRLAFLPGTRREIWIGEHQGRYEHILMLEPQTESNV